ncbi:TPA: hypothetical protein ACN74H_005330, partial [Klebsiella pneumoniae]
DARKRAYCLKIQPATGSFARNLIYSTKPLSDYDGQVAEAMTLVRALNKMTKAGMPESVRIA